MGVFDDVSVIIPTMACKERAAEIRRAVQSVRLSSSNLIQIIVVVNGSRADSNVLDWLGAQADIKMEIIPEPSLPGALRRGRELVLTDYFSTLDDDDVYLPGATDAKLAALVVENEADFLVGNSYRHLDGVDTKMYQKLADVPGDPLGCLMQFAWLHNGNALYRTKSVDPSFFNDLHAYAEWTWLAFRLTMAGKKVAILDQPVFRYMDTANSLSKSTAYFRAHIPLFMRMLDCEPPYRISRIIHRKRSAAHHGASVAALGRGARIESWKHHWKSLTGVGGWRYLSYTRHLIV